MAPNPQTDTELLQAMAAAITRDLVFAAMLDYEQHRRAEGSNKGRPFSQHPMWRIVEAYESQRRELVDAGRLPATAEDRKRYQADREAEEAGARYNTDIDRREADRVKRDSERDLPRERPETETVRVTMGA
jgi:hypothetical protein